MADFDNRICLVTGGASGIGRATCEALAARGAHVVVTDVDEAAGRAVVGLARGLAPPLAERGITLNAICPAAVDTKIFGPEADEFVREADLRLMPPAQIADAVIEAATGGETGQCWVCYDGREPILYEPAPLPRLG